VHLVEKISLYYKEGPKKRKAKEKQKEVVVGMLDTGILTSRIDRGLASRLGYTDAVKHFKAALVPKRFDSFSSAQDYIDTHQKLADHKDIVRLAKIQEDGKIIVSPVLNIDLKIAGQDKTVEMVLSSQTSMMYPVLIGRKELQGYLIDTSKTFTK
jgi:hypothetical protein